MVLYRMRGRIDGPRCPGKDGLRCWLEALVDNWQARLLGVRKVGRPLSVLRRAVGRGSRGAGAAAAATRRDRRARPRRHRARVLSRTSQWRRRRQHSRDGWDTLDRRKHHSIVVTGLARAAGRLAQQPARLCTTEIARQVRRSQGVGVRGRKQFNRRRYLAALDGGRATKGTEAGIATEAGLFVFVALAFFAAESVVFTKSGCVAVGHSVGGERVADLGTNTTNRRGSHGLCRQCNK